MNKKIFDFKTYRDESRVSKKEDRRNTIGRYEKNHGPLKDSIEDAPFFTQVLSRFDTGLLKEFGGVRVPWGLEEFEADIFLRLAFASPAVEYSFKLAEGHGVEMIIIISQHGSSFSYQLSDVFASQIRAIIGILLEEIMAIDNAFMEDKDGEVAFRGQYDDALIQYEMAVLRLRAGSTALPAGGPEVTAPCNDETPSDGKPEQLSIDWKDETDEDVEPWEEGGDEDTNLWEDEEFDRLVKIYESALPNIEIDHSDEDEDEDEDEENAAEDDLPLSGADLSCLAPSVVRWLLLDICSPFDDVKKLIRALGENPSYAPLTCQMLRNKLLSDKENYNDD